MKDNAQVEHARALHAEALVVDCHSHLLSSELAPIPAKVWAGRLREGGVDAIGFRFGGDALLPMHMTEQRLKVALWGLADAYQAVDEMEGQLVIATTVADMRRAKREGKIAMLLALEGGQALDDKLELLRLLHRLGVRRFQLTHNMRNQIADGWCEQRTGGGITEFGVRLIAELERLGMILDLSHLSVSSFWAALEAHHGPLIVSHTCARAVCDHPRNLWDDQIKAVSARAGVVGVAFMDFFISKGEPTLEGLVDHIDYIVQLAGVDHVGLGADYIYVENLPSIKYPPNLTSHADLSNVTVELVRRGYSDEDIKKILGENFLRVFEQILHA